MSHNRLEFYKISKLILFISKLYHFCYQNLSHHNVLKTISCSKVYAEWKSENMSDSLQAEIMNMRQISKSVNQM